MKSETKIKIFLSFLIPFLVIISGYAALAIAESWNNRFATKEYVSNRYMTKEHAEKYYFTKAEGDSLKATMCAIEKEVGHVREDIKLLVQAMIQVDRKLDKYLIINEKRVGQQTREPPKREKPPTAIVGNIK